MINFYISATTVGLGLAVLGIALVFRLITSSLVTFGLNFNLKEKLFVAVSWIPKGTVQVSCKQHFLRFTYLFID